MSSDRDELAKVAAWFTANQPTYDAAAAKRRALIRAERANGAGVADLARRSGLSRTAVYAIIR